MRDETPRDRLIDVLSQFITDRFVIPDEVSEMIVRALDEYLEAREQEKA
jgi:hypothetical protein